MRKEEKAKLIELSKELYQVYGITEWVEKTYALTVAEQLEVLDSLKKGEMTDLVKLVLMPYPTFVREYFKKLTYGSLLLKDRAFPFKLYSQNQAFVKNLVLYARVGDSINEYVPCITHFMNLLDDFMNENMENWYNQDKKMSYKHTYISQYIDAIEAQWLGLTNYTFYQDEEFRGFNFDDKLDCLNKVVREIMEYAFGANGKEQLSNAYEIGKKMNISGGLVERVISYVHPYFISSLEALESGIGLDKDYDKNEFRVYSKPEYRKLDMDIELCNIRENILSPEDKEKYRGKDYRIRARLMEKYLGLDMNGKPIKQKKLELRSW